jgi:hypothetical protein
MSVVAKPSGWSSHYSGESDRAVRSMYGQTLRQLYEVPRQMPHQLLVLLMQLEEGKLEFPSPDGEADC